MDSDAEIIWTARAKITFYNVLNYLDENWTRKELDQFYKRTLLTINAIRKNPKIFPVSTKNKDIRKAFIDKNNIFFYKTDVPENRIYLLSFFDTRQNP